MELKKNESTNRPMIPYVGFNSPEEAADAAAAVNAKFFETAKCKAYSTCKTLFVPQHKSMMMEFTISDFVKSIGGNPSSVR